MKKNILLVMASLFFMYCFPFSALWAAEYPSPAKQIEDIIAKVVDIVESEKVSEVRRKKLRDLIEPYFDFEYMAKASLGPLWNKADEQQRKRFVKAFSELLARTYLGRIEQVKRDSVSIVREIVRGEKALVKTTVKDEKTSFPIHYKLKFKGDKWEVYDVIIESIGLISNYRSEFAAIARKEGIEGLVKTVEEKVKD